MANDAAVAVLDRLYATILARKGADPGSSHTARLFASGRAKIAQKVGEEAVETALAAVTETPDKVTAEAADLVYHLLILLAECGIRPEQVWAELARREGTSGIAEKAGRPR
jgi:phosphoribosyl-ATP pyrophosphohydrolase